MAQSKAERLYKTDAQLHDLAWDRYAKPSSDEARPPSVVLDFASSPSHLCYSNSFSFSPSP